jgi:predicted dehydrogenase
VRIGVVGAGALGYHHLRLLRDVQGVSCAGFFEIDDARAEAVATELGVRGHSSLDALLDESDAVSIVVPTSAHAQAALQALERGRHVLVEKPLCATIEEADTILATADRKGLLVQTGHIERFNGAVRAALPYIDHPRFIASDRLAPFRSRGSDVTVVLDLMIHDIDLVLTLIGGSVLEVQAVGVPVLTPSIDIANARLVFADGAVATITASRVSRERTRKVRVFQRSGYLSLDLANGTGEFYRLREGIDVMAAAQGPLPLEAFVEHIPLAGDNGEPLRLELQAFADAITGRGPVVVTGADGREALAVAMRIMTSIEASMRAVEGGRAST